MPKIECYHAKQYKYFNFHEYDKKPCFVHYWPKILLKYLTYVIKWGKMVKSGRECQIIPYVCEGT